MKLIMLYSHFINNGSLLEIPETKNGGHLSIEDTDGERELFFDSISNEDELSMNNIELSAVVIFEKKNCLVSHLKS